jgi:hypothetical protein
MPESDWDTFVRNNIEKNAKMTTVITALLDEIARHHETFDRNPQLLLNSDIDEANYMLWEMPTIVRRVLGGQA